MQYANYKEFVIQKYEVELQGWTFEKLVNPSLLLTSLPGLWHLLDAINNGDCKFTKLSPLEVKTHCEELQKKQNEGTAPVKTCKPCKDCGTKGPCRKGNKQGLEGNDNDDNEEQERRNNPISAQKAQRSCLPRLMIEPWSCIFFNVILLNIIILNIVIFLSELFHKTPQRAKFSQEWHTSNEGYTA